MTVKILSLLFFILLTTHAVAQELNCDVTVNLEKIASSQRDYLLSFEADVERYLNNNRWTDEDFSAEEKIHCAMTIFFLTATSDNRYTVQIVVGSQRPIYNATTNDPTGRSTQILRLIDDKWEFTYVQNQQMNKDEYRFDPLADVLDFYAYLIIGMDMETYNELAGTKYLQKALNICNQATSSSYAKDWQQSTGSYSRFGIVDELMNLKNQSFRLAFYSYHFDGIDLLATEPQKGLDDILKAIEAIAQLRQKQDPRSLIVRAFFDAKYLEIADIFLQYPDRSVYDRLIAADQSHQNTYDDYRRRTN